MTIGQEPPEMLEQKLFYKGRKFNYEVSHLRLPNGVVGDWDCVRHPGGAMAVPITAEGKFVLVRQYRFVAQGRLLEFPAGTVEPTEAPDITIRRELEEETGYRAHRWERLGQFFLAPGYSDGIIYAYLAQDLEKLDHPPDQNEDEDIEVILMSAQELETAIRQGRDIDGKTIAGFYLALPYLQKG